MTRATTQFCPVSLASGVVGDRWTPLILREMSLGSTRFNDIERGLPGISRSLLAQRLRHLETHRVLERGPARGGRGSEYHLTPAGVDLLPVIVGLGEWAVRWFLTDPEEEQVDPLTLTWWMHLRVDQEQLPDKRVVIEFDYRGKERTAVWLVLDRGDPSVCTRHPGFDSDVVVTTEPTAFMRVFSGIDTLAHARRDGKVRIDGPPALTRDFDQWFLWSPFHAAVREKVLTG
jgi:DNA-binding HxlR family transcriptional regulator